MAILADAHIFVDFDNGNNANDGRDNVGFGLATADYTDATKTITEAGAFAAYTWGQGDQVYLSAGAGITPGVYEIASKTDNNNIVLVLSAGADSTADVVSATGPKQNTDNGLDIMSVTLHTCVIRATTETLAGGDIATGSVSGTAAQYLRVYGVDSSWADTGVQHVLDGDSAAGGWACNTGRTIYKNLKIINSTDDGMAYGAGTDSIFINVEFSDNADSGWNHGVGGSAIFIQCYASGNGGAGFWSNDPSTIYFIYCKTASNTADGFRDDGAGYCYFYRCESYDDAEYPFKMGDYSVAAKCTIYGMVTGGGTEFNIYTGSDDLIMLIDSSSEHTDTFWDVGAGGKAWSVNNWYYQGVDTVTGSLRKLNDTTRNATAYKDPTTHRRPGYDSEGIEMGCPIGCLDGTVNIDYSAAGAMDIPVIKPLGGE